MAAGKFKLYAKAKELLATGGIDLDTDVFKINLYTSASNANTLSSATITQLSDITNEVAVANGYTSGQTVTLSVSESAGTVTVDSTDPSWTASGGSITARYAVIYDDTNANDAPLCVCVLDTTPADVIVNDGNTLTLNINASGIFTLSGADSD